MKQIKVVQWWQGVEAMAETATYIQETERSGSHRKQVSDSSFVIGSVGAWPRSLPPLSTILCTSLRARERKKRLNNGRIIQPSFPSSLSSPHEQQYFIMVSVWPLASTCLLEWLVLVLRLMSAYPSTPHHQIPPSYLPITPSLTPQMCIVVRYLPLPYFVARWVYHITKLTIIFSSGTSYKNISYKSFRRIQAKLKICSFTLHNYFTKVLLEIAVFTTQTRPVLDGSASSPVPIQTYE